LYLAFAIFVLTTVEDSFGNLCHAKTRR